VTSARSVHREGDGGVPAGCTQLTATHMKRRTVFHVMWRLVTAHALSHTLHAQPLRLHGLPGGGPFAWVACVFLPQQPSRPSA